MTSQLPPTLLTNTYGARFLATLATTALYGILCLQTFIYYNTYHKDPKILKYLVLWVWIMDTVHQGMMMAYEYDLLILRFGDIGPIVHPYVDINLVSQTIFIILVFVPVQSFFLHRIYRLSGNRLLLPIFLAVCVVLEMVTGLMYTGWLISTPSVAMVLSQRARATVATYNMTGAFVDLAIAVSMVYLLRSAKVNGMSQTQRIITRLIIYSVNTGLWTAMLAIAGAVTMIWYPTTFVYIPLGLPLSSLYANTLLANLNIRQYVRGGMADVVSFSFAAATPDTRTTATSQRSNYTPRDVISIGAGTMAIEMTSNFDGSTRIVGSEDGSKGHDLVRTV